MSEYVNSEIFQCNQIYAYKANNVLQHIKTLRAYTIFNPCPYQQIRNKTQHGYHQNNDHNKRKPECLSAGYGRYSTSALSTRKNKDMPSSVILLHIICSSPVLCMEITFEIVRAFYKSKIRSWSDNSDFKRVYGFLRI